MPKSMQQKRQSSLDRLKEAYTLHLHKAHTSAESVVRAGNLARMIQQTEAAIQKGGR